MEYSPTIGLEIHVQLATKTKMFCRCDNDAEGKKPNTTVCPLCMGFPGTLPVGNETAIEWGTKTALQLGCKINKFQRFDRKHYFYPDLPKGYQISQFFFPVGEHGKVKVDYLAKDRKTKKEFSVGITRLHLEEDAGKLMHVKDGTLIDFNRCGTPLAEIVTEPDIKSPEEARMFLQELQRIVRGLGISSADMEKGNFRVDANVSVRPKGQKEFGTKVEVKNMNSFKFIEQALKHEIDRQTKILEEGGKVDQETRGWDEKSGTTVSQRGKEGSVDYRYFPEPDLPPIVLTDKQVKDWQKDLPELPSELKKQAEGFGLPYDRVIELQDTGKIKDFINIMKQDKELIKEPLLVANYPGVLVDFYRWAVKEKPSSIILKTVYKAMLIGVSIEEAKKNIKIMGEDEIEKVVKQVIKDNPKVVEQYKAGEIKVLGFLTGQVMAKTKGGAEPALVKQILEKLLTK